LLEQALPHHCLALRAHPNEPAYRQFYRTNLKALAVACADLGDHAAATDAADRLTHATLSPALDFYNAACIFSRCVPLAAKDAQRTEPRRARLADAYADRALALLRQAVQLGYKDVAHMKKDADLDPLRSREEFQKLLRELTGKGAP
jgi:hypothetical protein